MTKEDLRGIQRTLSKNRCWKGYKPVKGKRPYSKGSCIRSNGRKADKIASKTRGVDVFVFMKDKFAGTEAEDDIDKISRKNKGRDIGGGTDMRTGLREKQYYFRSQGDATRFIKMVKKLGVMKGYRASYADSGSEWPYKSQPLRLNPARCFDVTSTDWEGKENTLVYEKSLKPVCVGQKARSFRGDIWTVRGGDAPHKPSSTGRVYVTAVKDGFNRQFFPTVFKMKWISSFNLYPIDKVSGKSRLRINGVRSKTWKLGEYGGTIKVQVNQSGTAIQVMADGGETGEFEEKMFRWPLDKFKLEMYLNELTTSYYADKIIQWLMAGSWELRSNPAEDFSDEQIERSYKILTRYGRLRRLLKKYDVLELFPAGVRIKLIRKDPETMKLLPQLDEFMLAGNVNRRLIVDRVQGALDAYVDGLEQELERDTRNDARAYREVERRG